MFIVTIANILDVHSIPRSIGSAQGWRLKEPSKGGYDCYQCSRGEMTRFYTCRNVQFSKRQSISCMVCEVLTQDSHKSSSKQNTLTCVALYRWEARSLQHLDNVPNIIQLGFQPAFSSPKSMLLSPLLPIFFPNQSTTQSLPNGIPNRIIWYILSLSTKT